MGNSTLATTCFGSRPSRVADRFRRFALIGIAAATLAASTAGTLPGLTADDWADLRAGDVVAQEESAPRGSHVVTVSALLRETPEAVWEVVADCGHFEDLMPRTIESEAYSATNGERECRTVSDLPFPLADLESAVRSWELEDADGTRHRHFEQVPGDWSFEKSAGHWAVIPVAEPPHRTLLRYRIAVTPRLSLPDFIVRAAQSQTAPQMFEAISEEARRRTRPILTAAPDDRR